MTGRRKGEDAFELGEIWYEWYKEPQRGVSIEWFRLLSAKVSWSCINVFFTNLIVRKLGDADYLFGVYRSLCPVQKSKGDTITALSLIQCLLRPLDIYLDG